MVQTQTDGQAVRGESASAAHTPGPWSISEGSTNRVIWAIDGDGDKTVIAEVHWWIMDGFAESVANAHLIAAAPDLLEAVKQLLFNAAHGNGLAAHYQAQDRARAAIAQAEGRSEATQK